MTAELIAEHASVQPGGQTRVGVSFQIEPGWHIYAKEPGDAGLPTTVTWSGPSTVSFGPLEWPPHEAFLDPGEINTFGYHGTVVLSSALTVRADAALQPVPIQAHVEWLACKEICIPGSAQLALSLPLGPEPPMPSRHADLFR